MSQAPPVAGLSRGALARKVVADPMHWLPFGFGVGLLPFAPGTWGSLLAVALFWALPPLSLGITLSVLCIAFIVGCITCDISARRLGVPDHSGIVFDEIVAMFAVLSITPRTLGWTLVAFLLFRFFDIAKPWPIREADHGIPGGVGIMLDDVLAAIYAALLVRGVLLLPPI